MRSKLLALLLVLSLMLGTFATALAKEDVPEGPLVGVIVHTAKPYKNVIKTIEGWGGTVTFEYQNVGGLAAQVPADKLDELQALPRVKLVEKDYIVELPPSPEEHLSSGELDSDIAGVELLDATEIAKRIGEVPEVYYSYLSTVTGANDTWADTNAGDGSIIAVIDTGTDATHPCLAGRVIEGPDLSPDAGGPYHGSTLPTNYFHGTFVGGVIAAGNDCVLLDVVGGLFETFLPDEAERLIGGGFVLIPMLGIAPNSQIYAVKVFPHTGAGVPTSYIEAGLDHVITAKKEGLDIDVVNMSLGGPSLYDGRTLEEELVDAATDAGMIVVTSAGNEGPAPNSVSRPGTAFSALTVAAASDPAHTRIYWEYLGILPPLLGGFGVGPGQGLAMYPTDEVRPADFSSRGPLGDGRVSPDLIATGVANFSLFPNGGIGWGSGTSFSAPVVAGGAALLDVWAENNDPSIGPRAIRNAIMDGAVPLDFEWSELDQGHGYLNVANSLALLQSGKVNNGLRHDHVGGLKPNVLTGKRDTVSQTVTLAPGRTVNWIFKIDEETEYVQIDIDVDGPIDPGPGFFPNSFEFYVKSAKRGGALYIIDSANVFDDASVEVGDGYVNLSGPIIPYDLNEWPMEPGLMKVTLESDWTNNASELTATVTITRVQGDRESNAGGITATIAQGEDNLFFVDVPEETSVATFELSWKHDWSKFPTYDLDMILISPSFDLTLLYKGATLNSPENVVVTDPEDGTWIIIVSGYSVDRGRDPYVLEVTLE